MLCCVVERNGKLGEIIGIAYIYSVRWRNETVVREDTCWCTRKPGLLVMLKLKMVMVLFCVGGK